MSWTGSCVSRAAHLVGDILIARGHNALAEAGVQAGDAKGLDGRRQILHSLLAQTHNLWMRREGVVPLQQILRVAAHQRTDLSLQATLASL